MADPMFDATIKGLGALLDVHQKRHQVLASNLANVDTPGYQARDVDFRAALAQAFAPAGPDAAGPRRVAEAPVVIDAEAPMSVDGNTVDIDLQMAKLSANSGRYNTLAKILGKRFAVLRQSIEGTR